MDRCAIQNVALVTGSGKRRVGNVVARMLACRGYDLALHYNHSARDAEKTVATIESEGKGRARAFQADLTQEADVDRLFDQTLEHFGRLDVLVTTAATWESKRLEEIAAEDIRRQFEINTLGTLLCCRKGGLIMVGQPEGGAIVTIGDWAVARPYPDYAAYLSSKGAIPTITRTLAVELAFRNPEVRVNAILPGPVMLPEDLSAQARAEAVAGTLVRREGRPENIGHAVLFLVENDFVTGVCLPIDGGRTIGRHDSKVLPE